MFKYLIIYLFVVGNVSLKQKVLGSGLTDVLLKSSVPDVLLNSLINRTSLSNTIQTVNTTSLLSQVLGTDSEDIHYPINILKKLAKQADDEISNLDYLLNKAKLDLSSKKKIYDSLKSKWDKYKHILDETLAANITLKLATEHHSDLVNRVNRDKPFLQKQLKVLNEVLRFISPILPEMTDRTWDFEDGTMQGFKLQSGDCGLQPVKYNGKWIDKGGNVHDDRWNLANGGTYYVNTFRFGTHGFDEKKCLFSDKNHAFKITSQTTISWYESAQGHSVCLKRLSDNKELLCQRNSHKLWDLRERHFLDNELANLNGNVVYVTFADERSGHWDHMDLDNLKVTNAIFSV